MKVLDLFSGIGAFSLGLQRAGMTTVAFCEIDPFCHRVLAKHWPDVHIFPDVRELSAQHLTARGIAVDVICGGFPCQDISVAGKGAGISGERSGLWSEFARLIGEIRPRYVIVENVAALLSRGLGDVLGDLAALGFDAEWHCIPASAIGAPHIRDRVWVVAYASGAERWRVEPEWRSDRRNADVRGNGTEGGACLVVNADYEGCGELQESLARGRVAGQGQSDHRTASSAGAALSNADHERCEWDTSSECQTRADSRLAGGGQPLRIASRTRLEIGPLREWAHATTTGADGRSIESRLGRGSDGSSGGLDEGGIDAADADRRRQDVPPLRRGDDPEAVQRSAGRQIGLSEPRVLRSDVHGRGDEAQRRHSVGATVEGEEAAGAGVRGVPGYPEAASSSLRRESGEQQPSERPDPLQAMSRFLARALAEARTSNPWTDAGPGGWEAGLSRIVDGPAARVDRRKRLIGLGNSLVPQIPEIIGRAIMAAEYN